MFPISMPRLLVAFLAAFSMLGPARAAEEWVPVGETDELQDYVDASSIAREGDRVSAWFLDNFFQAQMWPAQGKSYYSRKSRVHFDCEAGLFAVDEVVLFSKRDGQGRVVGKTPAKPAPELSFEGVPEGSLLADMMDIACGDGEADEPSPAPTIRI